MLLRDEIVSRERYYGVYVGEVVDNVDPENWGRLKVRIEEIYGNKLETPTKEIPWASECSRSGGVFDSGSRIPYLTGSTVYIMFERGSPAHPIIMGGVTKKPVATWFYGTPHSVAKSTWSPPAEGTELPKEARDNQSVHVMWKTPKGATILVEEKDGGEFLRIIDRAGQVIEMTSPVQIGEEHTRTDKNVIDTDGMDYSKMSGPATIRIVDLAKQEIILNADSGKESVLIKSQNRDGSRVQQIHLLTEVDKEQILIEDKAGQQILMYAEGTQEFLQITDKNEQRIKMNAIPHQEYIEIVDKQDQWIKFNAIAGQEYIEIEDKTGQKIKIDPVNHKILIECAEKDEQIVTDWTVVAGENAKVTAGTLLQMLCSQVQLGIEGSVKKLCNEAFLQNFNSHTHNYTVPQHGAGTAPTGTPLQTAAIDTHTTTNTQAS